MLKHYLSLSSYKLYTNIARNITDKNHLNTATTLTGSFKHANDLTTKWHGYVEHQTAHHLHWPRELVITWLQESVRKVSDEE